MPNKGNNKRKIWKKYISEDLLPFEALDDFHKILKVIVKYKNLNEKIFFYNFGDTKNEVFSFFIFISSNAIYGFRTIYEYLNSLSILDYIDFKSLNKYNMGFAMENGDDIFKINQFKLYKVIKVIN